MATNLDLVLLVRSYLSAELPKRGIMVPLYSVVHPKCPKGSFIIVRPVLLTDGGYRSYEAVIEVCAYSENLEMGEDQTQPNLTDINKMTSVLQDLLLDAIIGDTAITSIRPTLVNDTDIRYFYNSIVCNTFNVKPNKI